MNAINNPSPKDLGVLLEQLTPANLPAGVSIHGLTGHSADVQARDLFVARRGRLFDGVDFLHEAAERGAAAAVFEAASHSDVLDSVDIPMVAVPDLAHKTGMIAARFFEHASSTMCVTAVTGTDGKTSVAHLLAQALQLKYGSCGFIGTIGCGQLDKLASGGLTTPDAIHLQQSLYQLRSQGTHHVAFEASSQGLEQGRLVGVDVDVAVFTNLGHDHLDDHGSIKNYAAAKEKLFAPGSIKHAVINVDDLFGRRLVDKCRRHCEVTAYASSTGADVKADNVVCTEEGIGFDAVVRDSRFAVKSHLLGQFNVSNLLAVFSVLLAQGISAEESASLLGRLRAVRGRMQRITKGERCVVVDYAHTPQALEALLESCRAITSGKLVCVFGCGGDRDHGKRSMMGDVASRLAEVVIVTDDNPRDEDPDHITDEVLKGVSTAVSSSVIHDRERAIRHAVSIAGQGDCVVVAGKGHETHQIVGDERLRFDDVDMIRRALSEMLS